MTKRLCVMLGLGLLLCTGCSQSNSSITVHVPNGELIDSVVTTVYPQEQSVFGDVYEPADQTRILVPKMPGERPAGQQKPPLLNTN